MNYKQKWMLTEKETRHFMKLKADDLMLISLSASKFIHIMRPILAQTTT